MKEKKKKIIILSIAIVAVIAIIAGSTYAYWQITKTQTTPNDIVAACLDLNLEDKSAAIDLDSAWPISDDEASSLTGYTFTVTNNCDEEINYIVGLNRVEEDNYLQDSSIKVRLDEKSTFTYNELSDVEYADSTNTYTSRVSKQVSVERIEANGSNEHTIRVWLSESAPVSEQSKIFQGQVFITGGQGIEFPELDECFTIANNGTIIGYNYECGTEVKVPAEINGIKVKEINILSFNDSLNGWAIDKETGEEVIFLVLKGAEDEEEVIELYKSDFCEEPSNCNLSDYMIIIDGVEDYNNIDWSKYEDIGFETIDYNFEINDWGDVGLGITSLDLSNAIYLEKIGEESFFDPYATKENVDETCIYESSYDYYLCNGILNEVVFPQDGMLTNIAEGAFSGNQITSLNIPSSIKYLSGFDGNKISELIIPSSVITIGKWAFNENDLTEIILNEGVKNIEESAFGNNSNLTELNIPSTVVDIGEYAFSSCNLRNLVFIDNLENPSNLTAIASRAFYNNQLSNIVLPASITTIENEVFYKNINLESIVIKRAESDVSSMSLSTNWNVIDGTPSFSGINNPVYANVTYDPNYNG